MTRARVLCSTFCILFILMLLPGPAKAGQTIIIDHNVSGSVLGNGEAPDGTYPANPADLSVPNDNTVIIGDGVTAEEWIYGSYASSADGSVAAEGNNVHMQGADAKKGVAGGYASGKSVFVADNSVVMRDSTVGDTIYGGYGRFDNGTTGYAIKNSVDLDNVAATGNVHGGYAALSTGADVAGFATGNSVKMQGGSANNVHGGVADTYGVNNSSASTADNKVELRGVVVNDSIYGGAAYADSDADGSASADGNSITIYDGSAVTIYGGVAMNTNGPASASGNSIAINGGSVSYTVYGGYSLVDTGVGAFATDNTVTLSGDVDLTDAWVIGGVAVDADYNDISDVAGNDAFTGNTLNVVEFNGTAPDTILDFEFLNFTVPADQGNTPVFEATDVYLGNSAGTQGSTITVSTVGGAAPMQSGDSIVLVGGTGSVTGDLSSNRAAGRHGATVLYDWMLELNGAMGELAAILDNVRADPQTKVFSEGFLASLALTTQTADLIADQAMENALHATGSSQTASGAISGFFAALQGGTARYDTGSHVDLDSLSFAAGFARAGDIAAGRLTTGAFFEYGTGSFDTYNSFANAPALRGEGDARHIGGGLLARLDFPDSGNGGWHIEASARLGRMSNDYDSAFAGGAGYDASSLYYGVHLGAGRVWNMADNSSLDLRAEYLWTRMEGDAVTLSTGDPLEFRNADSHRLRLGGRFVHAWSDCLSAFIGAAYEHEFDGEAQAATYGLGIDAPALRGGSGMGEIGLRYARGGFSLDAGAQGHVGTRQGVTAGLRAGWAF